MRSMVRQSRKSPIWVSVAMLWVLLAASPVSAQSYQILHSFSPSPTSPQTQLVQGTDGNFYGTTSDQETGGSGSIFRITAAGALTTLYRFSGPDGATPNGLVQ